MCARLLSGISLLVLFVAQSTLAQQLRVGPVYSDADQPGDVAVVVEKPEGPAPEPSELRLLGDGDVIATAADQVQRFQESDRPLAWVLCVDASRTWAKPLKEAREVLPSFFTKFRPNDLIALTSFAADVPWEAKLGTDPKDAIESLDGLKVRQQLTKLYDALYQSLEELSDDGLPKRRRVLVISDGKDDGSDKTLEDVISKSRQLAIPIDAVAMADPELVGKGFQAPAEKVAKQFADLLEGLANDTGGRFQHAPLGKLGAAFELIFDNLMGALVVRFEYEPETSLTTTVGIELQRGDESLRGSTVAKIPKLFITPSPPEPVPPPVPWPWFVVLLLMLIGLDVLIRRKKSVLLVLVGRLTSPPPKSTPPAPKPHHVTPRPEPTKPGRRTKVGDYFLPPRPGQPTAILIGVSGPMQGKHISVEKETFRIGANPGNDLSLVDDYVSGDHAYLRFEKGSLYLFDQRSKNGTFLNEERLTDSAATVSPADNIRVGASTFKVTQAAGSPVGDKEHEKEPEEPPKNQRT